MFGSLCTVGSIIKRTKEQVLVLLWESEQSSSQTAEPGDSGWSPHSQMSGQMCFGINDAFERVPNRIISQSVVVPRLLSNLSIDLEIFLSPKRLNSGKEMVCRSPYTIISSYIRRALVCSAQSKDFRFVCFKAFSENLECFHSRTMDAQWSLFSLKSRTFGLG